MGWPKGKKRGVKNGGRVKGTKNLISHDVRGMVLEALDKAGGVEYLHNLAVEKPQSFASLLSRTIPTESKAEVEHTGGVAIEVVTGFSSGPHQR